MNSNQKPKGLLGENTPWLQEEVYHQVKSRIYFIYEGCMAVGITSLSRAYLAGLLRYLGANDVFNGVIEEIRGKNNDL